MAAALGHGISVIPLPLPFDSPPAVNAYVIEGADGLTMIDCGVDWPEGRRALEIGFDMLGHELGAVHTLIVSHLHPDHVGMAPRLTAELGCRLMMHSRAAALVGRYNDTPGLAARTVHLADRHGIPAAERAPFVDLGGRPAWMPIIQPPDSLIEDGDRVTIDAGRHLEVFHTPGHEQAHICLRDSRTGIFFSGDHVLPRITPVIMYDELVEDALGDYLGSLRRLTGLRIGLTYPAHGVIVERGAARAEQILLHHDRRLAGMIEVLDRGPATAWMVMGAVYRPHLHPFEQRLALRETVSHLEHLRLGSRLTTFEEADVTWYRAP